MSGPELRNHEDAEATLRAKSAFLASISHEMRTPLHGVLGMLSLLLDTTLSHEQRHYVTTAQRSGEVLLILLNDVTEARIDLLRMIADYGDAASMWPVAYALKSSSLSLGVLSLAQRMQVLEDAWRAGQLDGVLQQLDDLARDYAYVRDVLTAIRDTQTLLNTPNA